MTIKSDRWIRSKCIHPTRQQHPDGKYGASINKDYGNILGEESANGFGFPDWKPMIAPFEPTLVRKRQEKTTIMGEWETNEIPLISYGLSSFGYDIRTSRHFEIFTNINSAIVDPKNFDPKCLVSVEADYILIPPNSFALARTVETFCIPRNVLAICLGKSTYARCGIIVNVTPLEPEWTGQLVLEFSNTTNLPAKIYANEGVAQLLFLESNEECEVSYADRGGKYQNQTGVTRAKV